MFRRYWLLFFCIVAIGCSASQDSPVVDSEGSGGSSVVDGVPVTQVSFNVDKMH